MDLLTTTKGESYLVPKVAYDNYEDCYYYDYFNGSKWGTLWAESIIKDFQYKELLVLHEFNKTNPLKETLCVDTEGELFVLSSQRVLDKVSYWDKIDLIEKYPHLEKQIEEATDGYSYSDFLDEVIEDGM